MGCSNGEDNKKLAPKLDDASGPEITLGAEGLSRPNVEVKSTDVTARLRKGQNALIAAHASDPESGVELVRLEGDVTVKCVDPNDASSVLERKFALEPKVATQEAGTEVASNWSAYLSVEYEKVHDCGEPFRATVDVRASARNFASPAKEGMSKTLTVTADSGPEQIRVGTYNTGGRGRHNPSHYSDWAGTLLRQVDIAFLQEVDYEDEHGRLQEGNNLAHMRSEGNNVILSRFPIVHDELHWYEHIVDGRRVKSPIMEASIDANGWRFVAFNNHWPHKSEHQPHSQAGRMAAMAKLLEAAQSQTNQPMIAAGDLNADWDEPEVRGLQPLFKEAFDFFANADSLKPRIAFDQALHCSDARVDYVMLYRLEVPERNPTDMANSGDILPYDGCWDEPSDADHPFVRVLVRRP